jgi:hypothetical protein
MKKITFKTFFYVFFLTLFSISYAQKIEKKASFSNQINLTEANQQFYNEHGFVKCISDEVNNEIYQKYGTSREDFENWIAPQISKIESNRANRISSSTIITIPVVVHVVHNGDAINSIGSIVGENISDSQAISQIQVMNDDFRKLAGSNGDGPGVDVEIEFCLAQQDASGNPTTGIVRHNITPYTNTTTPTVVDDWEIRSDVDQMKTVTQWDPTKYMNMWSIKPGGQSIANGGISDLLGYAQFPARGTSGVNDLSVNGSADTDGVVAGYRYFGTSDLNDGSFSLGAPYDRGRTMTHEVGHWVGLYHTFQGGCSGSGDYCADTPAVQSPNYGCSTSTSCGTSDMIQNYMDYTDDTCMDRFTQNQKDRVQAVMTGSPRRMELINSLGCQPTAPYISFELENLTLNESTDCNFTDITVNVKIGKAPTQPANVTITKTGTATDTLDYEIIGGSLVFPTVGFDNQSFTLRVYNDGFVEATETLTLGMSLNANSGDAVLTTAADKEMVVTINNNDLARNANVVLTHFSDDFEDQDISDWTTTDSDGDTYNWGDIFQVNDGSGNPVSPVSMISRSWQSAPLTPDNWVVSSAVDLTTATAPITLEWKVQASAASWDLEEYSVYVSTSNSIGTLVNSTTTFNEIYNDPADASTQYTRVLDLSAHAGETVYLAFRHWNCTDQDWLSIDDVNVTSSVPTSVQLAVNAANQIPLSSTGSIYSSDNATGAVMVDITNNNGVDYSCVSTNVSRASGTAQIYQASGIENYVMDKTFTISPDNIQNTGDATLKFYFTETEISAWETATGNNRSELVIIKDDGTSVYVSTTIASYGSNITLEGNFTDGINGVYYFGKQQAVLSVARNQFDLFSLYPNPSSDGMVNLTLSTSEDVKIDLFDITGRKVISQSNTNNSNEFSKTLNLSSLSSGVYLINVKSGGKQAIKKIVIQ